jgi:hypothetical protein
MKKNDLLVIIVVGIVAGVFSLVLSNVLFSSKGKNQLSAQKVNPINSIFQKPDSRYFNSEGINPTQLIQIGDSINNQPF